MERVETELDSLRAANARFYRALETLNLAEMDALWMHEHFVRIVHPGWDVIVGWDMVRRSWIQIFANTTWIRVTPTNIDALQIGEVGLISCSENITAKSEDDVGLGVTHATNLFKRTQDGWKLFHHHASPAPVQVTQPFSGTVQ